MSKEIEYIIEESLSPDRYCLVHNYIVSLQQKVEEKDKEIERLKDIINQKESMYDNLAVSYRLSQEEIEQLRTELNTKNNIINEIQWKPIEQYEKPKYDWVLIKYFIEPNFECIPCVAENRFGKWYDGNDNLINGEVRYFFDMQQLDKLKELKDSD